MNPIVERLYQLHEEETLFKFIVKNHFHIEDNDAKGNCLFNSIGEILYGEQSECVAIRKQVHQFYQMLENENDKNKLDQYDPVVIDNIRNTIIADTFDDNQLPHSQTIGNNYVYGNIGDVMICSLLFQCNILLFQPASKHEYLIIPIRNQHSKLAICLQFNGTDHFEAMLPIHHYNQTFIGKTFEDHDGKYAVTHYVTNKKHEDRMFYATCYENGQFGRKTEYQLLNLDTREVCYKPPVVPTFSTIEILQYRQLKNELKYDITIDSTRKKQLHTQINELEKTNIHLCTI
jgi:hypothetical protein